MQTNNKFVPDHRPNMDEDEVRDVILKMIERDRRCRGLAMIEANPNILFGVRAYFRKSIGNPHTNDLNKCDDAIAMLDWHRPGSLLTFNANVDPVAAGFNKGVGKLFCQLDADPDQIVVFRQGPHRGRPRHARQLTDEEAELAKLDQWFPDILVEEGPPNVDERKFGCFRVKRITADDVGDIEIGYQAINVHEAAEHSTGSWGCQTIYRPQWGEFSDRLYMRTNDSGQYWNLQRGHHGIIPYFFTERRLK